MILKESGGITSLNDDQPGESIASSKSSTNASVAAVVRTLVPRPSQRLGVPAPLELEVPPLDVLAAPLELEVPPLEVLAAPLELAILPLELAMLPLEAVPLDPLLPPPGGAVPDGPHAVPIQTPAIRTERRPAPSAIRAVDFRMFTPS
jgi:hypothetical protein